eukprot:scaffold1338_cov63-Phaeocystis_antarctica.AAC.2
MRTARCRCAPARASSWRARPARGGTCSRRADIWTGAPATTTSSVARVASSPSRRWPSRF